MFFQKISSISAVSVLIISLKVSENFELILKFSIFKNGNKYAKNKKITKFGEIDHFLKKLKKGIYTDVCTKNLLYMP